MTVTFDNSAPSSASSGVSSTSWTHNNSGNAIVVGVIWDSGGTDVTSAISYGGVALSKLGSIPSDNNTAGGISLWGRIGGLPTGSNTVSVTTGSTSCFGGSMSFFGAAAFGSAQTFFGNGNPVSVGATGTDPNGMIAAASSYGGGAGGGTFSATGAATQRFAVIGNNGGGSSNSEGETAPSAAGTVTFGWSQSNGNADFWGMVAVEILSGTITPDQAGSTAVTTGLTSATLDITAAAVGAACYAWVAVGSSNAGAPSIAATGWNVVQAVADSTTAEYAVLSRIKQAGDTTFTVTWSTAAHAELVWASWTGVNTVTPDEQSAIAANGATSRTAVPTPTATPTAADRWAVGFFAARTSTSGNKAITWTPDAAQTERVDANNSAAASAVWFGNEIADTAAAVSQAAHSYTATHAPAAESHDGSAILFLIPAAAVVSVDPPPLRLMPPGRQSPLAFQYVTTMPVSYQTAGGTVNPLTLAATAVANGAQNVTIGKILAAVIIAAGTAVRAVAKTVTATPAAVGTVVRSAGKLLAEAAVSNATVTRAVVKLLAAAAVATGTITAFRTLIASLAATAAANGRLANRVGKLLAGTAAAAGTAVRTAGKLLAATAAAVSTLTTIKVQFVILNAVAAVSSRLASRVGKPLAGTAVAAARDSASIGKPLAQAVTATATLIRAAGKVLAAVAAAAGTITVTKVKIQLLNAAAATSATLTLRTGKLVNATAAAIGSTAVRVGKPLAQAVTSNAVLTRVAGKILKGTAAAAATITAIKVQFVILVAAAVSHAAVTLRTAKLLLAQPQAAATALRRVAVTLRAAASAVTAFTAARVVTLRAAASAAGSIVATVVHPVGLIVFKLAAPAVRWVTGNVTKNWRAGS